MRQKIIRKEIFMSQNGHRPFYSRLANAPEACLNCKELILAAKSFKFKTELSSFKKKKPKKNENSVKLVIIIQ